MDFYYTLTIGILIAIYIVLLNVSFEAFMDAYRSDYPYQNGNKYGVIGIISLTFALSVLCINFILNGIKLIPGELGDFLYFIFFLFSPGIIFVLTQFIGFNVIWVLRRFIPQSFLYLTITNIFLLLIGLGSTIFMFKFLFLA